MHALVRTAQSALLAALVAFAGSCASETSAPETSPLAGLTPAAVSDSAGNPAPTGTPNPGQPGRFHGTVVGSEPAAPGTDTIATAPRLAGVQVTVYQRLSDGASPALGSAVASVTTGASGTFDFPSLPGGNYVVTFVPPSSSPYYGIWVTATAGPSSGQFPWWVVLGRK